jgi:autotransporter family porin
LSVSTPLRRRAGALALACTALGAIVVAPLGTASADEVNSGGIVSSVQVDRPEAAIGETVTATISVGSQSTRSALIDIEVYSPAGGRVFQQAWDNQGLTAGQTLHISTAWPTAELRAGTYTVKVGVFAPRWTTMLHWNNRAATVELAADAVAPAPPPVIVPPATTLPVSAPPAPPSPHLSGRFATLPPGAALPTGAQCATLVRPAAEVRPENGLANNTRGSRANANTSRSWGVFDRVDGDFAGTTDEIIQWAACKWGIDEDIVRSQLIKESNWYQNSNGDNGDSWGLSQVRQSAHPSAYQFSVNARSSSAYNLDYAYSWWRACFEGQFTWLNAVERGRTYAAGDAWGCVGVWFSGRWYVNTDTYLNKTGDSVRWHFDNKTWLTTKWINS